MEDDTDRVAVSRAQATDAVPEIDPVHPARALHRALMNREDHGVSLSQGHDLDPGLHARALLGEDQLSAGEVAIGLGECGRLSATLEAGGGWGPAKVPFAGRGGKLPPRATRKSLGRIPARLGEQDGDLEREDVLAVEVLMQAVEVALGVAQHRPSASAR